MEILKLTQGSEDWKAWRQTVIGASECPIILGLSPHQEPWDIWEQKVYGIEQQNLFIFNKGHEIEAKVRANYELSHGDCPPCCMQEGIFGASLDGWNAETKTALEIKYVGRNHVDVCPPHHFAQIQQQLFVSKAYKLIYLPASDERIGEPREFTFDKEWWKKNRTKLNRFWKSVTKARLRLLQQTVGEVSARG